MPVTITFKAQLPIAIKEEGNLFIACCPILDVMSQGYSKDEAKRNIIEAINLFLITCYEHGTLDEVMKESGFIAVQGPRPQEAVQDVQELVDVELPFISQRNPTSVECPA